MTGVETMILDGLNQVPSLSSSLSRFELSPRVFVKATKRNKGTLLVGNGGNGGGRGQDY